MKLVLAEELGVSRGLGGSMLRILYFALTVSLASCSNSQPVAVQETGTSTVQVSPGLITVEEAIAIATKAHDMTYDTSQPVTSVFNDGQYVVTFPVYKGAPPGTRYRGPDYAVKVWVDAKTGKVVKALSGS